MCWSGSSWLIIAGVGFLQGIGAGVAIAAVLFVITYSRVDIVRNTLSGEFFQSNVDRPKAHRDLLAQQGAEIYILRLQGFIFFGTIQAILNRIRQRLADTDQPKLGFIVLDFQRVTRLDSSAVFGITAAQTNGAGERRLDGLDAGLTPPSSGSWSAAGWSTEPITPSSSCPRSTTALSGAKTRSWPGRAAPT